MFISNLYKQIASALQKERVLLNSEKKNLARFTNSMLRIISVMMTVIFAVLCVFGIQTFNIKYFIVYLTSFFVFLLLSIHIYFNIKRKRNCYLFPTYCFILYLYAFGFFVSFASIAEPHAATSIICFQIIFPLLIFDRSIRVNLLVLSVCIIHTVLAYIYKDPATFKLDLFNGITFTLLGIAIGEYERYQRIIAFEKDRILRWQKDTDMLTVLPNRRRLFERLTEIQNNQEPLNGLFMIDIDHFKDFNDTLGHQAGDECLKMLGKCFADFGKQNEFEFYRYGGEEFCALTAKYNYDELGKMAEALRAKVQNLGIPFESEPLKVVTISVGYTDHVKGARYEKTIKNADDALYKAKRAGRNCIEGSR